MDEDRFVIRMSFGKRSVLKSLARILGSIISDSLMTL